MTREDRRWKISWCCWASLWRREKNKADEGGRRKPSWSSGMSHQEALKTSISPSFFSCRIETVANLIVKKKKNRGKWDIFDVWRSQLSGALHLRTMRHHGLVICCCEKNRMAVWKKTSILNNFITMVNTIMQVVELPVSNHSSGWDGIDQQMDINAT